MRYEFIKKENFVCQLIFEIWKKKSASLFPWIVLLKMIYKKKKWKIQKFKKLRMNDVKKCDVII